jgi:GH18 family chitinase
MKTNWMTKLVALLLVAAPAFAINPWYTAYYASWNQRPLGSTSYNYEKLGQTPADVDWTGITNVVHFGNGNTTTTPPYCTFAKDSTEITYGPDGNKTNYQSQLISTAHAHNVTVCLSIQAVDGAAMKAVVADQAKINVFAEWIVQYCKRHNYDGIELDWESSLPTSAQMTALITTLRATLDKYYSPQHALIVISPGLSDYNLYPAALDAAIDQYNVQLYALMWTPNDNNASWHECAVYPGSSTNGTQGAINGTSAGGAGNLAKWVTAGHSWSKMGMGLPTFGYILTGVNSLFQTGFSMHGHNGGYSVDQNSLCTGLLNVGGARVWDDTRKAMTITGTATQSYTLPGGSLSAGQKFFSTVPDAQQVREWVKWGKAHGIGGYMLYSLTEDLDPSKPAGAGRNVIHDALRDAITASLDVAETNLPESFTLSQNFPNPFNPTTVIKFQVSGSKDVQLTVYDMLGREVARLVDGTVESGEHSVIFDARRLASGAYFYRLKAGEFVETKRMVLLR